MNLAHSNEESIASALQYVKSNIHEEAKLATKQAKTIHINLPRDVNIQKIFTTMYSSDSEANGESISIFDYVFANTTMMHFLMKRFTVAE